MQRSPFSILLPFVDSVETTLFDRSDDIGTDAQIATALHTERVVSLNQMHGNTSVIVREPSRRIIAADGMWTDVADLTLTIRIADCQAFVAYDPTKNIVGILHAGWKGVVNGAIGNFIAAYEQEWHGNPSDLIVGIAPCLCLKCAEFSDPTQELAGIDPQFFHGRHADLRAIADDQFMKAGVGKHHIERHPDCTKCEHTKWWSYRGGDKEAVLAGVENVLACRLI